MSESRIIALERRVRLLQAYAIGATAIVVLSAAVRPRSTHADVVTAQRFVVLDENGNSRAVLGMHRDVTERRGETIEKRSVSLRMQDGDRRRVELAVPFDDEPFLLLAEEEGYEHKATLTCEDLNFEDDHEDSSASLYLGYDGIWLNRYREDEGEGSSSYEEFSMDPDEGFLIETQEEAPEGGEKKWRLGLRLDSGAAPRILIEDAKAETALFEAP